VQVFMHRAVPKDLIRFLVPGGQGGGNPWLLPGDTSAATTAAGIFTRVVPRTAAQGWAGVIASPKPRTAQVIAEELTPLRHSDGIQRPPRRYWWDIHLGGMDDTAKCLHNRPTYPP